MLLGFHVSISGSIDMAIDRAIDLNCNSFQIFTRNPRGWQSIEIKEENIDLFKEKCKKYNIKSPIVHMPYLPNLSSPKNEGYIRSIDILTSELKRCDSLNIPYLVTHLGSHLGNGIKFGLKRVINACSVALSKADNNTTILLENTAGTKNSTGSTFENLQFVLDNVKSKKIGICFDTAHAFAAGYDLRSKEDVNKTINLLEDIIGINRVKVIHLNDSKYIFNSHSDRHEHIGLGYIGENGFKSFLNHKIIKNRPVILETPIDSKRNNEENLKKVIDIIS